MDYEHYKRLIDILKNGQPHIVLDYREDFASAIEVLLAERDAAVNALRGVADCTSCKFYDGYHPECDNCGAFLEEWQWRGPQKCN